MSVKDGEMSRICEGNVCKINETEVHQRRILMRYQK